MNTDLNDDNDLDAAWLDAREGRSIDARVAREIFEPGGAVVSTGREGRMIVYGRFGILGRLWRTEYFGDTDNDTRRLAQHNATLAIWKVAGAHKAPWHYQQKGKNERHVTHELAVIGFPGDKEGLKKLPAVPVLRLVVSAIPHTIAQEVCAARADELEDSATYDEPDRVIGSRKKGWQVIPGGGGAAFQIDSNGTKHYKSFGQAEREEGGRKVGESIIDAGKRMVKDFAASEFSRAHPIQYLKLTSLAPTEKPDVGSAPPSFNQERKVPRVAQRQIRHAQAQHRGEQIEGIAWMLPTSSGAKPTH